MRRIDLTNQRFGNLIALRPGEPYIKPSGKKISTWECQCDCGNITTVRTEYLRSGHTKSCGCLANRIDLTGYKFGRLTVLKYAGDGKQLCQCDCGQQVKVKTYNLKNGNTQSCGCLQKERASKAGFIDLTGQRFGKLIVLERVDNDRFGAVRYKCRCDCGGITITTGARLKSGNVNSCGCIKSKGEMKINLWLTEHFIPFQPQFSFDNFFFSSGRRPFFDFAIFNKDGGVKCLIEYQGEQHYNYSGYGWNNKENFEQLKRRDQEKREICKKNNIKLYEIPYWDYNNIDKVLEGIIKESAEAPDMEEAQEVENG